MAKKPQKIALSAAAVYVITNEDIRRSGATCIPEALRIVPGLDVARISTSLWAVSARGFNGTYANKLLVLIDGRTIYNPFFSGVFWPAQDTLLEDVDRIEVIRGPGASLWGANAVNGIINIITKHTLDTKGGFISTGFGTEERAFLNTRYGSELTNKGTYRLYAKGFIRDESVDLNDDPAEDDQAKIQAGFRTDQNLSDRNDITLQGDIYTMDLNEITYYPTYTPPLYQSSRQLESPYSGGNILGRWTHDFPRQGDLALQLYYDHLSASGSGFTLDVDIIDMDFQHRLEAGQRQEIIWGAGYRFYSDDTETSDFITINFGNQTMNLFSLFLQDEIAIIQDTLFLTLGSKVEHNDYTGFEYQPTARILWAIDDMHTLWAAISRATRSPSRLDYGIYTEFKIAPPFTDLNPSPYPAMIAYKGNSDLVSETVIAHEMGYRMTTDSRVAIDVSVFYNEYDKLSDLSMMPPRLESSPPHLLIQMVFNNELKGDSRGCEISAWWKPYQALRLQTTYTYIDIDLEVKSAETTGIGIYLATFSPSHQASFNTSINLPWHLEVDIRLRYMDNIIGDLIEDYTTMDVHFAWKPISSVTFTIVGKDLLDKNHVEFIEETGRIGVSQVERSVYAGIKWTF